MKKPPCLGGFVPHIRVELMIFCVRGRCPGPLDECGSSFNFQISNISRKRVQKYNNFWNRQNIFSKNNISYYVTIYYFSLNAIFPHYKTALTTTKIHLFTPN